MAVFWKIRSETTTLNILLTLFLGISVHMPFYINGHSDNAAGKPSLYISDQLLCYRKRN